jgi:hypothetical protein
MANGHPEARHYPLGYMWSELRIVQQRRGKELKLGVVSLQLMVAAMFSKESAKELKTLMGKLENGG